MAVTLGTTGVTLRASSDVKPYERGGALVLDRNRAMEILRPCNSDLSLIRELRSLLGRGPGGPALADRDVIAELARKIENKEVLVFRDGRPSSGGGGGGGGGAAGPKADDSPPPPPPPPRNTSSSSGPAPESPTFAANSDGSAQAAAAQQAAQDGVPFCEH